MDRMEQSFATFGDVTIGRSPEQASERLCALSAFFRKCTHLFLHPF